MNINAYSSHAQYSPYDTTHTNPYAAAAAGFPFTRRDHAFSHHAIDPTINHASSALHFQPASTFVPSHCSDSFFPKFDYETQNSRYMLDLLYWMAFLVLLYCLFSNFWTFASWQVLQFSGWTRRYVWPRSLYSSLFGLCALHSTRSTFKAGSALPVDWAWSAEPQKTLQSFISVDERSGQSYQSRTCPRTG